MDRHTKRAQAERVRKHFSKLVERHGFSRTKTTFWTRSRSEHVEFIHLHLYSFRLAFRVHLGVRVLADSFEAIELNGPDSEHWQSVDLGFGTDPESAARCAEGLVTYVHEVGLPWLSEWRPSEDLYIGILEQNVARSRQLLGVD